MTPATHQRTGAPLKNVSTAESISSSENRTVSTAAMLTRVRAIAALGTTPIAYSLREVVSDFGSAQGEKLTILVTDGKEDCGGDACAVVSGWR